MDICSNKATAAELKEGAIYVMHNDSLLCADYALTRCDCRNPVPHHLINILDPNDYFTAGQFVRRATTAINDIRYAWLP